LGLLAAQLDPLQIKRGVLKAASWLSSFIHLTQGDPNFDR
jgi:hypothetical protein